MKILFLGFTKISYMPYMKVYLDSLGEGVVADLVYWDRDGKGDSPLPDRIRRAWKYEGRVEETWGVRRKLAHFWHYRRTALRAMRSDKYDLVVALHSTPALTVADRLLGRYRGRFIFDFRDLSHEHVGWYRRLVGRLVLASRVTFVSSLGFLKYLPETDKIRPMHNLLLSDLAHRDVRAATPREHAPIRLHYWGLIRHFDANFAIISALGGDSRFEVHYHGREQDDARRLREIVRERGYENVKFHGAYLPDERVGFAAETDILLNVYDNDRITVDATGNKYYDGLIFRLPQVCTRGSLMGELVEREGVGLALDLADPAIADSIAEYYRAIDFAAFDAACDGALGRVLEEYNASKEEIARVMRD